MKRHLYPSSRPCTRRDPKAWKSEAHACGGFGSFLLRLFDAIARNIQFQDDAVVDQSVDSGGRGHRVFEDSFPLGKRQVAGQQDAPAFIAFGLAAPLLLSGEVRQQARHFLIEAKVSFGLRSDSH